MRIARALSLAGIFALAVPAAGCFIATESEPSPPPPTFGTLSVDFTIAGSTDPALCSSYGVTDAELVVYASDGDVIAETYAPCADFTVGVSTYPGLYSADVTLVDDLNRARSITKPLESIRVVSDTELVIDVDFPPDSIL